MTTNSARVFRDQQLLVRKTLLINKLATLFARGQAHLEPLNALVALTEHGKESGRFHVDCILVTADGKSYYFTFGYSDRKSLAHPFFIQLNEAWFEGDRLIAEDKWLYGTLSAALGCQGKFGEQGISLSLTNVQLPQ